MRFSRRRFITSPLARRVAALSHVLRIFAGASYAGPVSDTTSMACALRSRRVSPKSLCAIVHALAVDREPAPWPEQAPSRCARHPGRRTHGRIGLAHFLRRPCDQLIQTAGLNILVIPCGRIARRPSAFTGPRRRTDSGITFEALPPIDVVLVSHNHYDHLDLATLSRLAEFHRRASSRRSATTDDHARRCPPIRAEGMIGMTAGRSGNGCRGHAGADAALVGARPVRPQQGAVVELRAAIRPPATSTSSAIPAMAMAGISAASARRMRR